MCLRDNRNLFRVFAEERVRWNCLADEPLEKTNWKTEMIMVSRGVGVGRFDFVSRRINS